MSLSTPVNPFLDGGLPVALNPSARATMEQWTEKQYLATIMALLGAVNFGGHVMANVQVIPAVDTSIYASGDTFFDTTPIPGATRTVGASCQLKSLVLLDKDDNTAAGIDLVFLTANVGFGTLNAAPSITDANAVKIIGTISLVAGDFIDVGGSKVATKTGLNLQMTPDTGETLYVAAITRGTPTQTALGIVLNLAFEQE